MSGGHLDPETTFDPKTEAVSWEQHVNSKQSQQT